MSDNNKDDHKVDESSPADYVELSSEEKSARNKRSIALGVALFIFVIIIYLVTYLKMGAAIFNRIL